MLSSSFFEGRQGLGDSAVPDELELREKYVQLKLQKRKLLEERRVLCAEVQHLREQSVRQQLASEVEEEKVANRLIRKVEHEERNIQRCEKQVAAEEETRRMLAGMLRNSVQEQTQIENQLEANQELFLLTLQRNMMNVAKQNTALEAELVKEQKRYLNLLAAQMQVLSQAQEQDVLTEQESTSEAVRLVKSPDSADEQCSPRTIETAHFLETLKARVNHLILQNEAKSKRGKEYEQQFSNLTDQFYSAQEAVSRGRRNAAKLRQDLKTLRQRVADIRLGTGLVHEDSVATTPESLSLAQTPVHVSRFLDSEPSPAQYPSAVPCDDYFSMSIESDGAVSQDLFRFAPHGAS